MNCITQRYIERPRTIGQLCISYIIKRVIGQLDTEQVSRRNSLFRYVQSTYA
jgi:hypothetical protein